MREQAFASLGARVLTADGAEMAEENVRGVTGDCGRLREMAGDGGRWREMAGDGGRWRLRATTGETEGRLSGTQPNVKYSGFAVQVATAGGG